MMEQALKHLMYVFECQVFEFCGPYETEGRIDYYVPYMMNDAVEDYLILKNCRIIGEYLVDVEVKQQAQLAKDEKGYVLAVRQGEQNAFTLYFEEIEEKVQCYQYHQIGHFWVKCQEQWRQFVYMHGTIYDKFSVLGEAFCNEKERKLLHLIEFAPLRKWSPIHDSLKESYPETYEGIDAMERLAKEAGDQAYIKQISLYTSFMEEAERGGLKPMTNFEISILLWIQENLRGAMDGFWMTVTSLADDGWFWIVVGVVLLFFKKTRTVGITLLTALLINMCMTNLTLKDLFARPRPYAVSTELVTLIDKLSSYSFPSGHTSVSFSGALVLYRMMPKKVGIPAVILAAMIGFSRMYVGVHFPTDVLGGIVVGVVASTASYYLVQYFEKKIGEKKANG